MTLHSIKRDFLVIARCFLGHNYPRVLSSNMYLTSVAWGVASWLAHSMASFMRVAGIKQLAWVPAPGLRGQDMAEEIAQQLTQELPLELALFVDIEQAVSWLQKTAPDYPGGCAVLPRSAAMEAQLVQFVKNIGEQLTAAGVADQLSLPSDARNRTRHSGA